MSWLKHWIARNRGPSFTGKKNLFSWSTFEIVHKTTSWSITLELSSLCSKMVVKNPETWDACSNFFPPWSALKNVLSCWRGREGMEELVYLFFLVSPVRHFLWGGGGKEFPTCNHRPGCGGGGGGGGGSCNFSSSLAHFSISFRGGGEVRGTQRCQPVRFYRI